MAEEKFTEETEFSEEKREITDPEDVVLEDDPGTLSYPLRDLLVNLLRGPYLKASDNMRFWELLQGNKDVILSQLANLYLTLYIDDNEGIAFIKNLPIENAPSLLNSFTYKLLDSVLIVELRERLMASETTGDKSMISRDEIASLLTFYVPFAASDQVKFNRNVDAVIERCLRRHFLEPLPNKGDFEISPILKVMFTASDVSALAQSYKELLKNKAAENGEDTDGYDVFA